MTRDRRLVAAAALLAFSTPFAARSGEAPPPRVVWPAAYEGRPLVPIAAAPADARLARGFPGRVARFSDGRRQIVLRSVASATRQLHPARDCFAAIGYGVTPAPMVRTTGGFASCFIARRGALTVRVCEQIVAADGSRFPDVSSWYWPALLGHSSGPWLAVTTVEPVA